MTQTVLLGDVVAINPITVLKKGTVCTFISMDKLDTFKRKIEGYETREYKGGAKFINGDTLLARITPCLENGKTAYVDILEKDEVGAGSTEFIVLREKEGMTNSDYIYYLSISPEFRKYAIQAMIGTSGRQRIQNDVLARYEFELPKIEDQREIGCQLRVIDEKIELNRQMNETLEQMGHELFKHYFIDNPEAEKWESKPLDEIADFLNGLAMQKYPKVEGEPALPVIKIREMSSGITPNTDISGANIPDKYLVDDGDLLFSWSGTLIVKFWTEGRGALNQHLFKVTSEKYPEWFYYYWLKHHLNGFIETAKSKATTMGHIQRRHLHEAMVSIPDAKKMKEFTAIFKPLLKQQVENMLEIQTLTTLRDTLLPRLISGKLKL